jgi:TPR repeat protein
MPDPGTHHRRVNITALRASLAVSFFAAIVAGTAIAGPLEDAIVAYRQGDYPTALRLLQPLADGGDARAQHRVGVHYDKGTGVPQDYAEAVKWYRKAADQGDARAQNNLGDMYAAGSGVPQDYVQAHKWYNLAVSRYPASETELRDAAAKNRDSIARNMTPEQIAEAQKLAREWKPK